MFGFKFIKETTYRDLEEKRATLTKELADKKSELYESSKKIINLSNEITILKKEIETLKKSTPELLVDIAEQPLTVETKTKKARRGRTITKKANGTTQRRKVETTTEE